MDGDGRPELVVVGEGVVVIFKRRELLPGTGVWEWEQVSEDAGLSFHGKAGTALAAPLDVDHNGLPDLVWLAPTAGNCTLPFTRECNELLVRCEAGGAPHELAVRWVWPAEPRLVQTKLSFDLRGAAAALNAIG